VVEPSLRVNLERVIAHGGPAQRAEALRLTAILESDPQDADARAASGQLVDAYLNDPYLERE
jgi:hypothetical protein